MSHIPWRFTDLFLERLIVFRTSFFICKYTQDGVLSEKEIMNHMEIFTAGPEGFQTKQKVKDEL